MKYISVGDQNIYLEYIDSYIYLEMPVTKKRGVNRKQKRGRGKGRGKTMKVMIVAAVPCPPAMIRKMKGGKGKGMRGGGFFDGFSNLLGFKSSNPATAETASTAATASASAPATPQSSCKLGEKPGILWGCRSDPNVTVNNPPDPSTGMAQ